MNHDAHHLSCTIEMADLNEDFDVAVIDEIQLIEDNERGFAWTNAILGLKAKEVHICGEERALRLVHRLLEPTNDEVMLLFLLHRFLFISIRDSVLLMSSTKQLSLLRTLQMEIALQHSQRRHFSKFGMLSITITINNHRNRRITVPLFMGLYLLNQRKIKLICLTIGLEILNC